MNNLEHLVDMKKDLEEIFEEIEKYLSFKIIDEVEKCTHYNFESSSCEERCKIKGSIHTPEDCLNCDKRDLSTSEVNMNKVKEKILDIFDKK